GVDIQTVIEIDLGDVATGVSKTLRFMRNDFCDKCGGSGAEPGSQRKVCQTCGGYGQVERQQSMGFLVTRSVVECPTCSGRGQVFEKACRGCHGSGRGQKERILNVKVPPGIHEGQSIRLAGEGEPGQTGTRGDLLCVVQIKPHEFFERNGDDLICRFPIGFTQAALGTQVEVPTLNGTTPLKIPAGTQFGTVFRLPGKGLPSRRNGRFGQLIVQVLVEIPKKLSHKQQDLLREFAQSEDQSVLPESKGFFDRVKEYFTGPNDEE
ncbi:MAG: molecular chaperone DnaJ, partial [Phycisphaerae bacterium]|nr:molecular chaperone DnaJ [Phycisphaerae bacterium]